jgi:hypothetical protein
VFFKQAERCKCSRRILHLLPLYSHKIEVSVLQLEQEDSNYIEDQECHELAKRYVKSMKNAKQDIIDMAERFEKLE